MENSYSNSNNGGSVNSQDSLWQMKMAAQANNAANLTPNPDHHHHHINDRNNHYGNQDYYLILKNVKNIQNYSTIELNLD